MLESGEALFEHGVDCDHFQDLDVCEGRADHVDVLVAQVDRDGDLVPIGLAESGNSAAAWLGRDYGLWKRARRVDEMACAGGHQSGREHGGLSTRLIARVDAPIFDSVLEAQLREGRRRCARHNDGIISDSEH